jgi:predicted dehydrogenase
VTPWGDRGLGIGLVGCGRLAEVGYLPALAHAHGFRLAAVADPDPERRDRLRGGAPAYTGAEQLLDAGVADALVLATPVAAHVPDARMAASRGVPTLVEKPPAPDAAGAAAMAALEPPPWIGFNRRFEDGPYSLRAAARRAGEIDLALVLHYRRRAWGAHRVADDALLDLGPHLVDLARWLSTGEPRSVRALGVDRELAEFSLDLGERGHARVSCATNRPHRELVEVREAGGRRLARRRVGGLGAALVGRVARRHGDHPLVTSLVRQLEAFGRAVCGPGDRDLATAADGYVAMTVIDAVRRSAAQGGQRVGIQTVPVGAAA